MPKPCRDCSYVGQTPRLLLEESCHATSTPQPRCSDPPALASVLRFLPRSADSRSKATGRDTLEKPHVSGKRTTGGTGESTNLRATSPEHAPASPPYHADGKPRARCLHLTMRRPSWPLAPATNTSEGLAIMVVVSARLVPARGGPPRRRTPRKAWNAVGAPHASCLGRRAVDPRPPQDATKRTARATAGLLRRRQRIIAYDRMGRFLEALAWSVRQGRESRGSGVAE